MSDDEIVWEEPPPANPRGGQKGKRKDFGATGSPWEARLRPLMERPGEWARVRVYDSPVAAASVATSQRRGKLRKPPGRWEFAAREVDDGRSAVYARYLGP